MKYSLDHPYLPQIADKILRSGETSPPSDFLRCSLCGEELACGEEYYDVNSMFFCMRCRDEAESLILDEVRESYIYEL